MAIRRKRLGNQHPFVAQSLDNIGTVYLRQPKQAEGEPLFKEAFEINRKAVGTVHPVVGSNLNNFALVYVNTDGPPQAEEHFRHVLDLDKKITGEANAGLAGANQSLGVVLTRERKFAEAERYLREAIAMKQKTFAADHWDIALRRTCSGRASATRAGTRRRSRCSWRAGRSSRSNSGPSTTARGRRRCGS